MPSFGAGWKETPKGNKQWWPSSDLSNLERKIFNRAEDILDNVGYLEYMSIPSLIQSNTIVRQGVVELNQAFHFNDGMTLSGSAEQGILERYADASMDLPMGIWARNQCFRREPLIQHPVRLYEFQKIEQFLFTNGREWEKEMNALLFNAEILLDSFMITHRRVDILDPGYHKKKVDIEVYTPLWGWVESHSCAYFADEQSKRFGITGDYNHTISCTMVASPRVLLPFLREPKEGFSQ